MLQQREWYAILLFTLSSWSSFQYGQPQLEKIQTVAGTGVAGFAGDGGPAIFSKLHQPFHVALDRANNLYVADMFNHRVRKINMANGRIFTIAGRGIKGYSGDGKSALEASMNEPYAVAVTEEGDLYIVDRLNAAIRRVDGTTGGITTLAGTGRPGFSGDNGPAEKAMMREPNDCCLDGRGGLLVADVSDWRIRRIDLRSRIITTFAGTGKPPGKVDPQEIGDGGPANMATIVGARGVCVDGQGNTYICEREGNRVRLVDSRGIISTIAGTGRKGYSGDGAAAQKATFNDPKGIRCDKAGNVFVVDTENHAIRKIDHKTRIVTTVAGGRHGGFGDGGEAIKAGLDRPHGCVIDGSGILYIADSSNHRVRKVVAHQ